MRGRTSPARRGLEVGLVDADEVSTRTIKGTVCAVQCPCRAWLGSRIGALEARSRSSGSGHNSSNAVTGRQPDDICEPGIGRGGVEARVEVEAIGDE